MYNLGKCYEEGDGVVKDLDTAQQWYTKAVAQDHARAKVQILKCKRLQEEYKKSEEGTKLSCNKRKNKQKHNKTKRTKT
jgi:TPR repeat protein